MTAPDLESEAELEECVSEKPSESERTDGKSDDDSTRSQTLLSRREFLADAASVGMGISIVVPGLAPNEELTGASQDRSAQPISISLTINGIPHEMLVEPRVTLLDAIRTHAGLPGTKKGCDHGQCGACTVHANGRPINSCLTLAVMHQRDKITTVEGLANGDKLHPVQEAFITHDGFQCGFCTPGQIMSAVALIEESHGLPETLTDEQIRERMSGNICRCGAYPNIISAIREGIEAEAKHYAAI